MKRKTMAASVAIALTTSALSLLATPASASPSNPYDTVEASTGAGATDIVGTGSDTTQIVMYGIAEAWNATHTPKIATFAADGLPSTIKLRTTSTAIPRPINSGGGKNLLHGGTDNPDATFARSSGSVSGTPSEVSDGLQQAAFAVDGLQMAVSKSVASHAPANLTPAQIVSIYKGDVTNWADLGGTSGTIKAYIPPSGSGTRGFFQTKLNEANGSAVAISGAVAQTQEHSTTDIKNDPNAIAPFSTARAKGSTEIKLIAPTGVDWERAVYNVVRNADVSNQTIKDIFGKDGFICSAAGRAAIVAAGFEPLATEAQGGSCGVFGQTAITTLTTFDDAGKTTTTLTGTPSSGNISLTATIGGLTKDGTVKFFEGANQVGTTKDVISGAATLTLTGVTPGSHTYKAFFTPEDPQLAGPSESDELTLVGSKATSTTTLSLPSSKTYGKEVVAAATVKVGSANAVGSVQFFVDNQPKGTVDLSGGVAQFTLPTQNVGSHSVKAVYQETTDTKTSQAKKSTSITQAASTTTASLEAASVVKGTAGKVDASVAVTGAAAGVFATGAVKVKEVKADGTKVTVGTGTLVNGVANDITLALLPKGKHNLIVKYATNSNIVGSKSATLVLTVTKS